jgi:hypothetical protein
MPSQTPTLVGNVGLGRATPAQSLLRQSMSTPPVLAAATEPEMRFKNGVALHEAVFTPRSGFDQRIMLAFSWSVDARSSATDSFTWQVVLEDAEYHVVQADRGDPRVPVDLRGQSLVSWFAIDTRREIAPEDRAPGSYQLDLEPIGARGNPLEPASAAAGGSSSSTLQLPVEIGPFTRCEL